MSTTPGQITVREIIQHINAAFALPEPIEHIYARGRWYEQTPARSHVVIEEGAAVWPIFKNLIDLNLDIPGISVELEDHRILIRTVPLYDPLEL